MNEKVKESARKSEWERKKERMRARERTNESEGKSNKENDQLKGENDIRKSERIIVGKYKKKWYNFEVAVD